MRLIPNVHPLDKKPVGLDPWEIIQNAKGQQLQWNPRSEFWVLYTPAMAECSVGNDGPGELTKAASNLGMRFNTNKVRFDLIPASWTLVLAQILTKGAQKYAPRNWEKGLSWSETLGSLHRHLNLWVSGETYDAETKCHHLGHVAWNALALMTMQLRGVGKDDIPEAEDGTMEKE